MKDSILFLIIGVCFALLLSGLYFGLFKPQEDRISQMIEDDKAKSNAENMTLHSMSCKQLGDWLLSDKWFDRDNLIWAQNQYSVGCK